jgi:hypothetical protein
VQEEEAHRCGGDNVILDRLYSRDTSINPSMHKAGTMTFVSNLFVSRGKQLQAFPV